jgi:hypothetical protein
VACNVCEYAVPTVAPGKLGELIASVVEFTTMFSPAVAVCGVLSESFAWTVKANVAAEVGVPEMTPEVDEREIPGGRAPLAMFQV